MNQPADLLDHADARPAGADDAATAEAGLPDDPREPSAWHRHWTSRTRQQQIALAVDAVIVAGAMLFVFMQLQPSLLFADTTPAGGDMGAHVWGPAFLRDVLLPDGRLTGWAPDWYAGFPAYQFYMVLPALLIVAVNAGWQGWAALLPVAAAVGLSIAAWKAPARSWRRRGLVTAAGVVLLFGVGLPYGVAFKLVTVLGPVTLPLACYAFGRLAGLQFPAPALLAAAALPFLVNREPVLNNTGNIIGGNLTSTLAGEYSFAIALSLAVVYFGVVLRGLQTGRHRALAAVLIALTGLCHLIPAIYALVATAVALVVSRPAKARLWWLATMLPVGGLISAFWVLPFWWQRAYVNNMGWEKTPAGSAHVGVLDLLTGSHTAADGTTSTWRSEFLEVLAPDSLKWVLALAAVGLVVSVVLRLRAGIFLAGCGLITAVAFVVWPEGRLWNARLLPFWLLCVFLLAGLGVAEIGRAVATLVARDPDRPSMPALATAAVVAFVAVVVSAGMTLGALPFGRTTSDGGYGWFAFEIGAGSRSPARSWARWNYSGYERKAAYPEYYGLISTMSEVGEERGCGRAMWEYESERLNSYGTPMAPMLLPFWTDGCIGSMEGLFFESSATTPYHFLTQSELSTSPSRAQRDLPYGPFDINEGVDHLQLLGVRYYLAFTDQAVREAATHPDLTEIATSGPWHVYEVADAALVEPLANQPAVLTGVDAADAWLTEAVEFYADPQAQDVFLAADGPDSWERVDGDDVPTITPVEPVEVSDIEADADSISFHVDEPGTPILVKASYFPNWEVSGADGPYRVTPNLMVVVPTSTTVELHYGWAGVDIVAWLLTILGVAAAVGLARRPPVQMPEPPAPVPADDADADADDDSDTRVPLEPLEPLETRFERASADGWARVDLGPDAPG